MHRSGTSAVAGTAVRLGLAAPRTPLPDAGDNPAGFYESHVAVVINHYLLRRAGCTWNLCLNFEPDHLASTLAAADWQAIGRALDHEFAGRQGFVFKDPRLCLTLPAWIPALRAAAAVSALIVVRHPAEVMHSLALRNRRPEAETAPHWLHHMLEAERVTRGLNRAVVFYDDLLRDWRRCMTQAARHAAIAWPCPVEQAATEIDDFLAGSARHHRASQASAFVGQPDLRDLINGGWTIFRGLANDPHDAVALACLDHVRRQFADWRLVAYPPGTEAVLAAT